MKTIINPKYSALGQYIAQIPQLMEHEGDTLHAGRNLIKVLRAPDGTLLNVKRYHRPSFFNALVYSTALRKPKGQRAFEYPARLLAAGVDTPEAVAYIEERRWGVLRHSWLVSIQCPYRHRLYELAEAPAGTYEPLADALAAMTARMHEAGMLHRDYSPGNILWDVADGNTVFSVVDINRMRFGKVTLHDGCANFARLWGPKKFFERLARVYAQCRNLPEEECVKTTMECRRRFWTRYARHHRISFKLEL